MADVINDLQNKLRLLVIDLETLEETKAAKELEMNQLKQQIDEASQGEAQGGESVEVFSIHVKREIRKSIRVMRDCKSRSDVEIFLCIVDNLLENHSRDQKIVMMILNGAKAKVFNHKFEAWREFKTFEEFEHAVGKCFFGLHTTDDVWKKIDHAQMKKVDFKGYVRKFRDLHYELEHAQRMEWRKTLTTPDDSMRSASNIWLIRAFIKGLNGQIAGCLAASVEYVDLEDVIAAAGRAFGKPQVSIAVQRDAARQRKRRVAAAKVVRDHESRQNTRVAQTISAGRSQQSSRFRQSQINFPLKCFGCGIVGHKKRNCRVKRVKRGTVQMSSVW